MILYVTQKMLKPELTLSGEGGFNSLTRGFNFALSAFSDDSKATYGQVFLGEQNGVLIMASTHCSCWDHVHAVPLPVFVV